MKISILIGSVIGFFILIGTAIAKPMPVLAIEHWQTHNGASVYFVHAPELPMVDLRVVFAAGSAEEGQAWGLASLVNNLIGQRTTTQTANAIADGFDRVGAQFTTDSNRDMALVNLRSLVNSRYLNPALTNLTDVLNHPQFVSDDCVRLKNQALAELKVEQQDPGNVAEDVMYQTLYGHQPYAHNPLGTPATIAAMTLADVNAFYHRYYVARNADVIIVGDVTRGQAQRMAEQVVGALPAGKPAVNVLAKPATLTQSSIHVTVPTQQTAILLGQVGITSANPDYFPLIVGNHILGGMPMNSILFKEVRDQRGLAYFAYSYFTLLRDRGPYLVSLKTKASQTKQALSVVEDALQQFVKTGPTPAQLIAAKRNLIGAFPLALATNKNILNNVTAIAFKHRPLDYLDTYRRRVNAVTLTQIRQAMQRYIHPQHLMIVTVGPK